MGLKERGLFSLDAMSAEGAVEWMDRLGGCFCGSKVEALLYGPRGSEYIIRRLRNYGKVFADLKTDRTPTTAAECVGLMARYGAHMVSIQDAGDEMLHECIEAYEINRPEDGLGVVIISLLTSFDERMCKERYGRTVAEQVAYIAERAAKAGAWGIVCSGVDLPTLKVMPFMRGMHTIITAIRSEGKQAHDQKRYATPAEVARIGADYYVIGRQVRGATDPIAEADMIDFQMRTAEQGGNCPGVMHHDRNPLLEEGD